MFGIATSNNIGSSLFYLITHLFIEVASSKQEASSVSIIFGGDISFAGIVEDEVRRKNCRYKDAFSQIKPYLDDVDLRVFNLMSSFGNPAHPPDVLATRGTPHLLANTEAISALEYIKTDAVILATNHLLDYGDESVFGTVALLEDKNISYSGLTYGKMTYNYQSPLIFHHGELKLALFSYCMSQVGCVDRRSKTKIGPAVFRKDIAVKELNAIRQSDIDAVIVSLNWGDGKYSVNVEYPQDIVDTLQIYADVIIGSHPSIDYGHHYWNYTLIVPSLGAFLYPMHVSESVMDHAMALKISDAEIKAWSTFTKNYNNPTSRGRLLQLHFNSDGLIRESAKYALIDSDIKDKRCLYARKKIEDEWKTICRNGDPRCIGENMCATEKCRRIKKSKKKKTKLFQQIHSYNDNSEDM